MNLELLTKIIQNKLTSEEYQQLVTELKTDSKRVIDTLDYSPTNPKEALIHKVMVCFEREKHQSGVEYIDAIDDIDDLEKIELDISDEFFSLVEELSRFDSRDIVNIIVEFDTGEIYKPYGNFIAGNLLHELSHFLTRDEFVFLRKDENLRHL